MARTLDPLLGGHLSLEEFEVLVRGEWRRVLGRAAYDRVHEARLARSLVALAAEPDSEAAHASLRAGLDQVVADLASTGAGRDAVRGEIHALFLAMYNVLTRAGASAERSAALRVASEQAVETTLGYSMELPMQVEPSSFDPLPVRALIEAFGARLPDPEALRGGAEPRRP